MEKVALFAADCGKWDLERSLAELGALAESAGMEPALQITQKRSTPDGGAYLGEGRLAEAKAVLMQTRHISEDAAYDLIRAQAMAKRMSMDEIALAIINANEILNIGKT
mgnify:CR=1 FL=1